MISKRSDIRQEGEQLKSAAIKKLKNCIFHNSLKRVIFFVSLIHSPLFIDVAEDLFLTSIINPSWKVLCQKDYVQNKWAATCSRPHATAHTAGYGIQVWVVFCARDSSKHDFSALLWRPFFKKHCASLLLLFPKSALPLLSKQEFY